MGYDVEISHAADQFDEDPKPIPRDSWIEFMQSDPDWELDADVAHGEEADAFALSRTIYDGEERLGLRWTSGLIYAKTPNEELVNEMCRIATIFGARVMGEEGEFYRSASDTYYVDDDGSEATREDMYPQRRPDVTETRPDNKGLGRLFAPFLKLFR